MGEQVDARKRLAEHVGRVGGAFRAAALRVCAVEVPVAVHLAERAQVDRLTPLRDRPVDRDQVRVALPHCDRTRRDRLATARPAGARAEADHRHRPVLGEEHREPRPPRVALVPAEDGVSDVRLLARQRAEAARVAEDAERRLCRGGLDENARRAREGGEQEEPPHSFECTTNCRSFKDLELHVIFNPPIGEQDAGHADRDESRKADHAGAAVDDVGPPEA
jgi:hypothetical protein